MDRQQLLDKYGDAQHINNRVVLRIYNDAKMDKKGVEQVMTWAEQSCSLDALRMKLKRTANKHSKLRGKARDSYEDSTFEFPDVRSTSTSTAILAPQPLENSQPRQPSVSLLLPTSSKSPIKRMNLQQHDIEKKKKVLSSLHKKIHAAKNTMNVLGEKKGRYSIKNVNKRETRAFKTRKALKEENCRLRKRCKLQQDNIINLQNQNSMLKDELALLKVKAEGRDKMKREKRKAEKRCSFHKIQREKLEKSMQVMSEVIWGDEDDGKVKQLKTKENGKYKESLRMCVWELAGLEVATGKMADVIESVAHLCNIKCSSLPSKAACQNMIDESQYMSQNLIGDKVRESGGIGIHKDGTTRRKVKILDSTVQLDNGSSYSLGFSSVAAETGEAIAEDVKGKLRELDDARDEEEFLVDAVEKLKYFMNDRAGNEKKSTRLLESWRNEMLSDNSREAPMIHHLHCTAHVLLGFQNYILASLKTGKEKHPISICLRDAADLFGPVGDHRGCRNVWEAYCLDKGINSTIQNFKDNRFNGFFEVSAQVFHHRQDFLKILDTATNNSKQQKLRKALQDKELVALLECLGLFFFKFTGPFWSFAISKNSITELPSFIQKLYTTLQNISERPHTIFDNIEFLEKFGTTSTEAKASLNTDPSNLDNRKKNLITIISAAMIRTIEKQLADMLAGGVYGSQEGASTLSSASFAPMNNLSCERNFGELDASQRRRPRASLHHHSSIIMLKQNRKELRKWCDTLLVGRKKLLWAKAISMGKLLRKNHRANDKQVLQQSLQSISTKAHQENPEKEI